MAMAMAMQLKLQDQRRNNDWRRIMGIGGGTRASPSITRNSASFCVVRGAVSRNGNDASSPKSKKVVGGVPQSGDPQSNYVVPLGNSSSTSIIRPLEEILRDLNKRIPDNIIVSKTTAQSSFSIPWYHANRMLSFYAPGWCGEIRDVIYSENGTVTVVYRLTIRGSDGEAYRESSGTISSSDGNTADPVAAAEEIAFCRACARFGLGLYLYHEEK
ncbi:hypothetical protein L484_004699 [Morus notabilis]|uniref:DNA repair RAD52-like protein n=1 Tax=Morus notabilis TaxID=981085 RepID=W9SHJ2_9ROSA|nr:DNA repair RAD52-like protein 2, chloroplastic [Morus notabilis]EXC32357.1 hypothetical protein L484_004699 [Morus notabilis]